MLIRCRLSSGTRENSIILCELTYTDVAIFKESDKHIFYEMTKVLNSFTTCILF